MAFDGPMLAAAVVQALGAIPGAIRDTFALLKGDKTDSTAAMKELTQMKDNLLAFCEVEESLQEAKSIHDRLHRLDTELEGVRGMYGGAIAHGQFNEQEYKVPDVRKRWYDVKNGVLTELLTSAQSLKYIEDKPLTLDHDGAATSGPQWAVRFVELRSRIDRLFDSYDKGKLKVRDLAEEMNALVEHVKRIMFEANSRIIREASAFADQLRELRAALRYL